MRFEVEPGECEVFLLLFDFEEESDEFHANKVWFIIRTNKYNLKMTTVPKLSYAGNNIQ